MEIVESPLGLFLRVDPGERLVRTLEYVFEDKRLTNTAIISGVGMLSSLELGFFRVELDDYERTNIEGVHDLSSVAGNVTWLNGRPRAHVHIVANKPDFSTLSGHLIEAVCHITVEMFLSTNDLHLRRVKLPGCPATRIIGGKPTSNHE